MGLEVCGWVKERILFFVLFMNVLQCPAVCYGFMMPRKAGVVIRRVY